MVATLKPWVVEGRPKYYQELGLAVYEYDSSMSWIQFEGDIIDPYRKGKVPTTETVFQVLLDGSGQVIQPRGSEHGQ